MRRLVGRCRGESSAPVLHNLFQLEYPLLACTVGMQAFDYFVESLYGLELLQDNVGDLDFGLHWFASHQSGVCVHQQL